MTLSLSRRAGLAAIAASALITLSAKPSRAEQLTLFDVTFDFTWEDATTSSPSKSHYYVKESSGLRAERPDNWLSPIDYRNGKVHIHLEVLEKPAGGQKQGWALCYVGKAGSYGCPYTDYYTDVGVYEKDVDMTSFYNNDTIDWSKGIAEVDLVYTINDSGQGHVHFFPELKDKTTPTKVRIAMVQVAKGSTYDSSQLPGAGGSGGNAGAGGTGGAGGAGGAGANSGGAAGASAGSDMGGIGGAPSQGGAPPTAGQATSGGGAPGNTAGATATSGAAGAAASPIASDSTGCSTSGAPPSGAAWLLLGLGFVRRRRATAR